MSGIAVGSGSGILGFEDGDGNRQVVNVQNPLPSDGDSVYVKDIWVDQSTSVGFSGVITDLFDNLHSTITNVTATNPKEIVIHFNRTIVSNVIGLGAYTGNFSNTLIQIGNSGGVFTTVINESADNTKYTSRTFQLPITAGFNALKIQFHTTDTITLSNCVILKTIGVVARLQATKPDGTVTDINATAGGNLKVAVEEFDESVTTTMDDFSDNLDGKEGLQTAAAIYGRVNPTKVVPIKVDASTSDIQTVDHEHAEIHGGDHYEVTDVLNNLALNNVWDIRITTPDTGKWGHFNFTINPESETEWHFYENVNIITTPGDITLTPYNNERNSANMSGLFIDCIANSSVANANLDTAVAGAIELKHSIVGSGKQGGIASRSREIVLKQNKDYVIRFIANAAGHVNYDLEYYEHTNKN